MFEYRRRVAFGDCDSARIIFTPKAFDYAVEAVEAWYGEVLGVCWADLLNCHNLEVTFERAGCEYFRSLVADQMVQVRVEVVGTESSTIVFSATGVNGSGEPCFRATLEACFISRGHGVPVPIPSPYRKVVEACRTGCADTPARAPGGASRGSRAAPVTDSLTRLPVQQESAGPVPFTEQRRIVYGDCTACGTIYLPRIISHAVEAVGQWYKETLKVSWLEQCVLKRGVPFVTIRGEFGRPVVPGQLVTLSVRIPRLGTSSIDYAVTGHDEEGRACFSVHMSACYISEESGTPRAMPFPEEMRGRILAYQAACAASAAQHTKKENSHERSVYL